MTVPAHQSLPVPVRGQEPEPTPAAVVARLSTDRKIRMLSGRDFWNTESGPGFASVLFSDGPHGLRKQVASGDHLGLGGSVPATCFPTASALGATWDPHLVEEIGVAIGREAAAQGVGVVLGPGLNIKRHPGGGRNFEYFSEDPLLSGHLAAAMVRGLQSQGVGACLKHFAANNQEFHRMRVDTLVDERTLREIYLTGFEIAVRGAKPWSVMSSYNQLNGEYTGASKHLLTDVLRTEWGFDGVVMTDWLGVTDRPAALKAGLDLEMPSSNGAWDARTKAALDARRISEDDLDRACERVVALAQKVTAAAGRRADAAELSDLDAHHQLARRAAAQAATLLTNDGILPLAPTHEKIALIGAFAETPRFQGAGSSLVNATRVDSLKDTFAARLGGRHEITFAPGYDARTGSTDHTLLAQARKVASEADVVVLVVGLPASYETEGVDRTDLRLPSSHDALVEQVCAANPRTVVVLVNGAPVTTPWADRPAALLEAYLGGQAAGAAITDVLVGDVEPGGRLAESIPYSIHDVPADADFARVPAQVQYRETHHVGYRFHDTAFDGAVLPARFPFGHGLGYTTVELSDLVVAFDGDKIKVGVTATNSGPRTGASVVQVYVHDVVSSVARPEQELKAFERVYLIQGESRRIEFMLDSRAFAVWDVASHAWAVEAGDYEIRVGRCSSVDLPLRQVIEIGSHDVVTPVEGTAGAVATSAEFVGLLGRPVPLPTPVTPFTEDSTVGDLDDTWLGRQARKVLENAAVSRVEGGQEENSAMLAAALEQLPLRAVVALSGGKLTFKMLDVSLKALNAARRK
ncbi:beta-glucosidase family protein [Nocardioides yefusunii]|uniref:Beta-glucosidase n=1 Tax=Nocardioides yefusunii TaxID=2500546 RepID=A0ABW1QS84_9ACTN|nr:glycoside hydrolase family 3 C-terminal domain-containing protein [Nocardioides yefusunii]